MTHQRVLLEAALANLHGTEAALIFTSRFCHDKAALAMFGRQIPSCRRLHRLRGELKCGVCVCAWTLKSIEDLSL